MSGAAGTTYLLDIEVETDKATGQLMNFRKTANAEVGAAGREMGAALTSAEATTAKAAVGMTDSLGKLRPLMGTITRGLGAMGVEGAGAFSGLTRGAITLMNTGFTPLGLAVAGVVAGLGVYARSASEARDVTKDLRDEIDRLGVSNAELAQRMEAKRQGIPFDEFQAAADVAAARDRIRGNQIAIAVAQKQIDEFQSFGMEEARAGKQRPDIDVRRQYQIIKESLDQISKEEQNVAGLERRLNLLKGTSDEWKEILATIQRAQEYDRSQIAPGFVDRNRGGYDRPHDRLDLPSPFAEYKPSPALTAEERFPELAAAAAAERQRRAEEAVGIRSDFDSNRAAEAATRDSRDEVIQANAERQAAAFAEAQKEAMRIAARDAETFRGFGEQGAASITAALNRSIQSGDFRSFFAQFQAGMSEAVISAFTYALIQKPLANALGDVTQGIGGLFGYGKGGGTGTGAAQSGTMETFMANGGGGAPKSVRMNFADGTEISINNKKASGGGVQRGKSARWAS